MKIVDMKVRCGAIPTNAQLRHNTGVHPGYFMRTILELVTDEGIVGLGEVGGGDQRGALFYAMLASGTHYQDRSVDYEALTVARNAPRWLKMLKKHGFIPAPEAA